GGLRQLWHRTVAAELALVELEPADSSELALLHAQSFPRAWTDGEFERLIIDPTNLALALRQSAHTPLLAFILVRRTISAGEAEILSIAVDKFWQRRGLGYRLLDEAIRRLNADSLEALFLEVDEANTAARALYDRLGFEQVGRRKGYYARSDASDGRAQPPGDALVMKLCLR
ncbi:MAG: GNAT family N-acetyltransferase, partial [Pseudomonadota bacterium]